MYQRNSNNHHKKSELSYNHLRKKLNRIKIKTQVSETKTPTYSYRLNTLPKKLREDGAQKLQTEQQPQVNVKLNRNAKQQQIIQEIQKNAREDRAVGGPFYSKNFQVFESRKFDYYKDLQIMRVKNSVTDLELSQSRKWRVKKSVDLQIKNIYEQEKMEALQQARILDRIQKRFQVLKNIYKDKAILKGQAKKYQNNLIIKQTKPFFSDSEN